MLNLESVGFIAHLEGVSGFTNSACVGGHHTGVSAYEVVLGLVSAGSGAMKNLEKKQLKLKKKKKSDIKHRDKDRQTDTQREKRREIDDGGDGCK